MQRRHPWYGDALKLHVRLAGAPKPDVLRAITRELQREARQALESAARTGQAIPPWVEEIITDAGREHYARVASQGPRSMPQASHCSD